MAIPRKPKSATAAPAPSIEEPADTMLASPAAEEVSQEAIMAAVEPVTETAPAPAPVLTPARIEVAKPAAEISDLLQQGADKALAEVKAAQEKVRHAAEQGLEQTRATYEKFKTAAEEANASLETSYAAAARGLTELNQKALGAMKAHADATFAHVKAVIAAKSVPEVMTLSTAHVRDRFEAVNEQIKDMATAAQRVAADTAEPLKAVLSKRFAA